MELAPAGGTIDGMDKISAYWKTIVGVIGTALMIWNTYSPGFAGILPEDWVQTINLVVGVLTATGVFGIANTTRDPLVANKQSVRLQGPRHARPE